MNISYTKVDDYLLPDLKLEDKERFNIGKYGLIKLEYLKKNKRGLYTELLMKDKLNEYLYERLKQNNQILWVGKMNNIKNIAEEIVLKELIYGELWW